MENLTSEGRGESASSISRALAQGGSLTMAFPAELKAYPHWILWRLEADGANKPKKVPYDPRTAARCTGPQERWGAPFETAMNAFRDGGWSGLGFVLKVDDPFVFIDLDNLGPLPLSELTTTAPLAYRLVECCQSYTEISQSGTGLHIIVKGSVPDIWKKRCEGLECYQHSRFIAMTGVSYPSTPLSVEELPGDAKLLLEQHLQRCKPHPASALDGVLKQTYDNPDQIRVPRSLFAPVPADDGELIATMRRVDAKAKALFDGRAEYDSKSEAALALCNKLAYYTHGDASRMDRLFRLSAQMREKWDEPRGERTWGAETIAKALEDQCEKFDYHRRSSGDAGGLAPPLQWAALEPIERQLLPVKAYDSGFMAEPLREYVADCAELMDNGQPDYVAVGLMVALSSLIGRRLAIRPKRHTPWTVVPNLWGAVVGRPSRKKSPLLREALAPLERLNRQAQQEFDAELLKHRAQGRVNELIEKELTKKARKLVSEGAYDSAQQEILASLQQEEAAPVLTRYLVNDTTMEKLGEILMENPMGVLLFRDELTGFLASLDREDQREARAFYLESWNGTGTYCFDRITRDRVEAPTCLSLLGGIQPTKLERYLSAQRGGLADDGLIERLQLLVYPDQRTARYVDRAPNQAAWRRVEDVFERVARIPSSDGSDIPYLQFDAAAQEHFKTWVEQLGDKIGREPNPYMESHLGKYASLMPSLALIDHVVTRGHTGSVSIASANRAIAWCDYLESHARRVHALLDDHTPGALMLVSRVGMLPNPFSARDVQRKGWNMLSSVEQVREALSLLTAKGYLQAVKDAATGGRPRTLYHVHPELL